MWLALWFSTPLFSTAKGICMKNRFCDVRDLGPAATSPSFPIGGRIGEREKAEGIAQTVSTHPANVLSS